MQLFYFFQMIAFSENSEVVKIFSQYISFFPCYLRFIIFMSIACEFDYTK